MKNGIAELLEVLKKMTGVDAIIRICHKLYGDQKLKCEINPIIDNRIGLCVKGQEIYMYKDEIKEFSVKDGIFFADGIMSIKIKQLNEQL